MYAIGQRVELVRMDNDPNPVPIGSRGVIVAISESGDSRYHTHVGVKWDNGRSLSVLLPLDEIRLVTR